MQYGARIAEFIEAVYGKNMQGHFASLIDILPATMSKYITGDLRPGTKVIIKFSQMGMSIDWLMNGTGSMYADNEAGRALAGKQPDILRIPIEDFERAADEFDDNGNMTDSDKIDFVYKVLKSAYEKAPAAAGRLKKKTGD